MMSGVIEIEDKIKSKDDLNRVISAIAIHKAILRDGFPEEKLKRSRMIKRVTKNLPSLPPHTDDIPGIVKHFNVSLRLWRLIDKKVTEVKSFTCDNDQSSTVDLFLPFYNIGADFEHSKLIVSFDAFCDKVSSRQRIPSEVKKPIKIAKHFDVNGCTETLIAAFALQSQLDESARQTVNNNDVRAAINRLRVLNIQSRLTTKFEGVQNLQHVCDKLALTVKIIEQNGSDVNLVHTISPQRSTAMIYLHAPYYNEPNSFSMEDAELILNLDALSTQGAWRSILHHVADTMGLSETIDELKNKWTGTKVKYTEERKFQSTFGVGFNIVSVRQKHVKKANRGLGIQPQISVRRFYMSKFDNSITLELKDRKGIPKELDLTTDMFRLRLDQQLTIHECKHEECVFVTEKLTNLQRHEETCNGQQTRWTFKRVNLTAKKPIEYLRQLKLLPSEYNNTNFATFDIECRQSKEESLKTPQSTTHSFQALLSIAVHDSFTNRPPVFFLREENTEESLDATIDAFLHHLFQLQREHRAQLPSWVDENCDKLNRTIMGLKSIRGLKFLKHATTDKQKDKRRHYAHNLRMFYTREERMELFNQYNKLHATAINEMMSALQYLKRLNRLRVYGFNSERYDLPVIIPSMLKRIEAMQKREKKNNSTTERNDTKLFAIKRGLGYMTLSVGNVSFVDARNFIAGGGLSDFVKTWTVDEEKLCFPFELFEGVTDMRQTTTFPDYHTFRSTLLKQTPVCLKTSITQAYSTAKKDDVTLLFETFAESIGLQEYITVNGDSFELCDNVKDWYCVDPDVYIKSKLLFKKKGLKNMVDYLKLYNCQDTVCLTQAFKKYLVSFFHEFKVNANDFLSLPAMAEQIMWSHYDTTTNSPFTFDDDHANIHLKVRNNMPGGLSTCFARHIEIQHKDEERCYHNTVYETPDGSPITQYISFDVNSKLSQRFIAPTELLNTY